MKSQMNLFVMTLVLFGTMSAEAHRVQFSGSAGSTANLLVDALSAKAVQSEGAVIEAKEDGSIRLFKEDTTCAINCVKSATAETLCEVVMKHERPLADFSTYPIGDQMTLVGDTKSNASMIAAVLLNAQATDSTIKSKQYSPTGLRIVREDASLEAVCIVRTGVDEKVPFECALGTN